MKNSSRLLAEIDRNFSRSRGGWPRLADSSRTRRLKLSQDSSRLMKRSGLAASAGSIPRGSSSVRRVRLDSNARTVAWPRSAMARALLETMIARLRYNSMTTTLKEITRRADRPSSAPPLQRPRGRPGASAGVPEEFRGQRSRRRAALAQGLVIERDHRGAGGGEGAL